ncbi:uncharacterized protein LOC129724650 [Wyeomyia smithii]|uniref:uncharacterized protein LOC129724650 n=1 Tax=Wyeomyia smithii TaxID=174621 RepID=UPI002467B5DE|nr:uncharacterized protein LOC129724650 [Wyeomyia smithii]
MDDTEYFTSDSSEDELIIAENLLVHTHFILTSSCATRNGGSRSKKKPNINRVAEEGAQRLYEDYFSGASIYTDAQFRRRFRMSRKLFLKIANDVKNSNQYFIRKPNAAGQLGLNYLQKCTAAVRQLAYGIPADALDEYTRMAESTARKCLKEFCKTVETLYEKEFLRHPNEADIQRLLKENEQRGFPGMLGSLDCCHWEWKNCPTAWAGQYKGKQKKPSIVLEAVASYDLWIWHAFFGMPGSNNDINVLNRSPLFSEIYSGQSPAVKFVVNARTYTSGYYLADGIYPPLATLVQTITHPIGLKRKHFAKMQEAVQCKTSSGHSVC